MYVLKKFIGKKHEDIVSFIRFNGVIDLPILSGRKKIHFKECNKNVKNSIFTD